ncbi:MAG TPA: sugar phosphate isomerase/epimerase family protein [Chloroflexia bacterium]|nr:sugar phosphate isomerase/epimerase family protein [Chloroflexia bacterium]
MIRLAAFGDEIAPDLDAQIAGLQEAGVRYLELRAVDGINVLDLTDGQVAGIRQKLAAAGIGVSAIASPIGKVPISSPFGEHQARFARALALAHTFETPLVRIFSFYPPAGAAPGTGPERGAVLARLRTLVDGARAAGVTLLHENEQAIYGDTIARCVDLLQTLADPHLAAAFDPANFVQCGQVPDPDACTALQPWIRHVHVKDVTAEGRLVPAGAGVAGWPGLLARLRAAGYDGFFTLEPHLAAAGPFQGFSGPDQFRLAARAFQDLLQAAGWAYA